MPVRKKVFPCGHKGRGRYCHRCGWGRRKAGKGKRRGTMKWKSLTERIEAAPIDLSGIPKGVARKALEIIEQLAGGRPYHKFRGKRLKDRRWVISIPVGWSHRLICRDDGGAVTPVEVVSHEEYNLGFKGRRLNDRFRRPERRA